jgi:hypothetical protein
LGTPIKSTISQKTEDILKRLADERKERNKDVDWNKYLEGFDVPMHSKKCKTCYGLGRVGFQYDPETKTRGESVICPKYMAELEIAVQIHAIKKKAEEDREMVKKLKAEEEKETVQVN